MTDSYNAYKSVIEFPKGTKVDEIKYASDNGKFYRWDGNTWIILES